MTHQVLHPWTEVFVDWNIFDQDILDIMVIHFELYEWKNGWHLILVNKQTSPRVTVKLRYYKFEIYTKQITIPYSNADRVWMNLSKNLSIKLFERMIMIRMVGIWFTNLISCNYQIKLFEIRKKWSTYTKRMTVWKKVWRKVCDEGSRSLTGIKTVYLIHPLTI